MKSISFSLNRPPSSTPSSTSTKKKEPQPKIPYNFHPHKNPQQPCQTSQKNLSTLKPQPQPLPQPQKQIHSQINQQLIYSQYRTGHEYLQAKQKAQTFYNALNKNSSEIVIKQMAKIWKQVLAKLDRGIRSLTVQESEVMGDGLWVIFQCEWLRGLQALNLCNNRLGWAAVQQLCGREWSNINEFNLSGNKVEGKGLQKILKKKWKTLTNLQLNKTGLFGKDLKPLLTSPHLNLHTLALSQNKLGINGMKYLSKANLPELRNLELNECQIGSAGCQYLVKGRFPKLKHLDLQKNQIGLTGIKCLQENNWKQLISIGLNYFSIEICAVLLILFETKILETTGKSTKRKIERNVQWIVKKKWKDFSM